MKKKRYILFTSSRGPTECCLAVYGIQDKFKKYLLSKDIAFEIIREKKGRLADSLETIVFKIESDVDQISPWLGSLLWVCKSPIRKSHKRKNWYIKCEEVHRKEQVKLDKSKVMIQAYRASGPGGQHRNKVETAIRIIHRSTGMIVTASDGKSQAQNKKKAWAKLEQKLEEYNEGIEVQFDFDQWSTQLEIERGDPSKIFKGKNFIEL